MAIKPLINEKELLVKVADGDDRAFAEIFRWYYQPLGQAIHRLTESLPSTQEIIQDAFIQVWQRRETLPQIGNFSGYLYILCRNGAFAAMKKQARQRMLQPALEQHLQWDAEQELLESPSEHYRRLIEDAVANLPEQQRRIYEMSRYQRLRYEEIARQLGLSADTVKTQVYNAVKSIRKQLGSEIPMGVAVVLTSVLTLHS
jgi:RNA polymerase sigma-70 factor (ECF subfamily)